MKRSFLFLSVLLLVACKNKESEDKLTLDTPTLETTDITAGVDEEEEAEAVIMYPKEENIVINFLTPNYYYKDEFGDYISKMSDKWLQLNNTDGLFQATKANYVLSEIMNECTVMEQIGVFSPEKVEPIFFFAPNTFITKGVKESLNLSDTPLWPSNPQDFLYNGKKYTLRSEGKEIDSYNYTDDDGKTKVYKGFTDFKLYLRVDNEEQLMLTIKEFQASFIKLVFVGDLDNDGKLDFIIDTSEDYESEKTDIYLSKGAQHLIYLAGENLVDKGC